MTHRTSIAIALFAATLWAARTTTDASPRAGWTTAQLAQLRAMAITALDPLPADPTNRVADDPRAADLGRRLFFDTRLSANGRVACGTCHQPERTYQDGIALAVGVGTTARRTMPLAGMARAPFLFWDGRKDSLWAQALGPLESPVEHGGTRAQYARVIADHYRSEYEALFGPLPDLTLWDAITDVFVSIGKAIAAYERQITFGASRFDRYVEALAGETSGDGILRDDELAGLRLFIGRANCSQCHDGPLLTNHEFHNTGVPPRPELPLDHGRLAGASSALDDEFNCRSRWSDARRHCAELDFIVTGAHTLERAYKVPSLRNVAERAPYMHAGQFATLADVLDHYNRAPAPAAGHSDLRPLRLRPVELRQLEAFLRTLTGPVLVGGRTPTGPMP